MTTVDFDTTIGWESVYPPADAEIADAIDAADNVVLDWYSDEGVLLKAIAEGDELWDNGPKADRWTIALDDDWHAEFSEWAAKKGVAAAILDDDYFQGDLYDFAAAVADASDRELKEILARRN